MLENAVDRVSYQKLYWHSKKHESLGNCSYFFFLQQGSYTTDIERPNIAIHLGFGDGSFILRSGEDLEKFATQLEGLLEETRYAIEIVKAHEEKDLEIIDNNAVVA